MRKSALLLFLVLAFSVNQAAVPSGEGIKFETGKWSEILAKAQKENKLIFLDAFASWCGPCKWMAKNIFTNDTAAAFYNKNFVNAKIDMEKGEGIEIAKKYGVQAYPTLLYINGNGELVHRTCGSTPTQEFINNGKNALNPEKQLASLKKKFEKNSSDAKTAVAYFNMAEQGCMSVDQEVSEYLKSQKESDLKSKANWNIIKRFLTNADTREFNYVLKNKKEFAKLYSKDSVDEKIVNVYETSLRNLLRLKDNDGYSKLKEKIRKSGDSNAEKVILKSDMTMYQKNKDWTNYAKTADKYVNKYAMKDAQALNSVAWTFYENVSDKKMLQKAEKWAKKSTELTDQYFNNDTYAAVLYKNGKMKEAEKIALKAIDKAKKEGADYKETEELLQKIKPGS